MKSIMAKYNYAFGYVKGYFVLTGLVGLGCVVFALGAMLTRYMPVDMGLVLAAIGAAVAGVAVLIVVHTRSQCPPERRGIAGLVFSMLAVGVVGAFWIAFKLFALMLKLIFRISISSGTEVQKFASSYYRESDGENYMLYSTLDANFATLHDGSGNSISVRRHSGELLCDDAGNLYYPR